MPGNLNQIVRAILCLAVVWSAVHCLTAAAAAGEPPTAAAKAADPFRRAQDPTDPFGEAPAKVQAPQPPVAPAEPAAPEPSAVGVPTSPSLALHLKAYRWSGGKPPVKMIRKTDGFCFLSAIHGPLANKGDAVRVYIDKDGYWYLGGQADKDVSAEAMSVCLELTRAVEPAAVEPAAVEPAAVGPAREPVPGPLTIAVPARTEVKLPAPVADLVVGGSGDYLVLHLEKLRKLAVFDTVQGKVLQYLPAAERCLFAAGREHLLVVDPAQQMLHRYHLKSQQRELSAHMPIDAAEAVLMGAAADGPLLVRSRGQPPDRGSPLGFIDLKTLKPIQLQLEANDGDCGAFGAERCQMWASSDGTTFGCQRVGVAPTGLSVLTLQGNTARVRSAPESVGYVMPSPDGSVIFTAAGLFNAELEPLARDGQRRAEGIFLPCVHPGYYLGLFGVQASISPFAPDRPRRPTIAVYSMSDRQRLFTLPELEEFRFGEDRDLRAGRGPAAYKRLHFLPAQQRLITIPETDDRLIVREFDLLRAMDQAGSDYLFVASLPVRTAERGRPYAYQLDVKSRRGKVEYRLESGPEGMLLSNSGQLTWTPPSDFPSPEVGVILVIKDASGQEVFHAFAIRLQPALLWPPQPGKS